MKTKESIEIPLGAKDSELKGWEYTIPEGYTARIEGNKVIIKPKESEDEKIRKAMLQELKDSADSIILTPQKRKRWIAWLEKQGEHTKFLESIQIGDEVTRNPDGVLVNLSQFKRKAEQGSQNLANSEKTCKEEPKFKVGDWVVQENIGVYKIIEICESWYEVIDYLYNQYSISFDYESMCHLWTIQDAKDGDVLVDGNLPFIFKKIDADKHSYAYCGISVDDNFKIESDGKSGEWTWMQDIKPATLEQCGLLFQKMKEAGYEWDAEKKELRKIEQKPAWSEEDEANLQFAIDDFQFCVDNNQFPVVYNTEKHKEVLASLKSLKTRYTWKPSVEQIETLNEVIKEAAKMGGRLSKYNKVLQTLKSLYNDLKELKG